MAIRFKNEAITQSLSVIGKRAPSNQLFTKGGDFTSTSDESFKNLYLFVVKDMNNMMSNYAMGNFSEVSNELTQSKYDSLVKAIYRQSQPGSFYYEQIRTSFSKTLAGMQQSIYQYGNIINIQSQLDACNEKVAILNDFEKLKEHILSMNRDYDFFKTEPITMIMAELKPQYAEYIRRHGLPVNGIFDADKLAIIINEGFV